MKKCKLCNKDLPKSRISSDYCLPCEDKVDEWVRLQRAAQSKTAKEKLEQQGEEILKQAKQNFEELVKTGESLIRDISVAGELFFEDLSKKFFESKPASNKTEKKKKQ